MGAFLEWERLKGITVIAESAGMKILVYSGLTVGNL